MSFLEDPEVVIVIAFTVFVALLLYLRVHKLLAKALDDRSDRIREELDERSPAPTPRRLPPRPA